MTTVRRALASISALTCVAILTSACLDLPSLNRPDIPDGIPPGLGTPVPFVDINAPGRTAEQLRDWARPISDATGIPVSYTHLTLPTSDLV